MREMGRLVKELIKMENNPDKPLKDDGKRNISHNMLPLAGDVKYLTDYLNKIAEETYQSLIISTEKEAVKRCWVELSEIVLAQTIVFNRRRAGEVLKMTIE
ncbi:hypothetical protein ACJMK2_001641 [Sinanodonta woodiana]|uniref:Uncharacterized protein n=1 Tax=Sinanodonta woodiana TaxID=1069815 RepID=A0ABD3XW25_SINWO